MTESITATSLDLTFVEFLLDQGYEIFKVHEFTEVPENATTADSFQSFAESKGFYERQELHSTRPRLHPIVNGSNRHSVYKQAQTDENGQIVRDTSGNPIMEFRDVMEALTSLFQFFNQASAETQIADNKLKLEFAKTLLSLQRANAKEVLKGAEKQAKKLKEQFIWRVAILIIEAIMFTIAIATLPWDGGSGMNVTVNFKIANWIALIVAIISMLDTLFNLFSPGGPLDKAMKKAGVPKKWRKGILILLMVLLIVASLGTGAIKGAGKAAVRAAVTTAKAIMSAMRAMVKAATTAAKATLKAILKAIMQAIKAAMRAVANAVKNAIRSIIKFIQNSIKAMVKAVKSATKAVVNQVKTAIVAGVKTSGNIAKKIMAAIKAFFAPVARAVKSALRAVKRLFARLSELRAAAKAGDDAAKAFFQSATASIRASTAIKYIQRLAMMGIDELIDATVKDRKKRLILKVIATIVISLLAGAIGQGAVSNQTRTMAAMGVQAQRAQAIFNTMKMAVGLVQGIGETIIQLREGLSQLKEAERQEKIDTIAAIVKLISALAQDQTKTSTEFQKMASKATEAINKAFDARIQAFNAARQSAA